MKHGMWISNTASEINLNRTKGKRERLGRKREGKGKREMEGERGELGVEA